jgi:hypothetical protein
MTTYGILATAYRPPEKDPIDVQKVIYALERALEDMIEYSAPLPYEYSQQIIQAIDLILKLTSDPVENITGENRHDAPAIGEWAKSNEPITQLNANTPGPETDSTKVPVACEERPELSQHDVSAQTAVVAAKCPKCGSTSKEILHSDCIWKGQHPWHRPDSAPKENHDDAIVENFAANLIASQEPLDPGFAKVLDENRWELYEQSDSAPATAQPEARTDEVRATGDEDPTDIVYWLKHELAVAKRELEIERTRLAACGVVARADTPESAAEARHMHEDYRSASCYDVALRVDECMRLRTQLEAAERERDALRDFAQEVMLAWPEFGLDGGALQDIAINCGLLRSETRHAFCGEDCYCVTCLSQEDAKEGFNCWRKTPLLTGRKEE